MVHWICLFVFLCAELVSAETLMTFVREDQNGRQIYLGSLDRNFQKQITFGNAVHLDPDISSDGKFLAFSRGLHGKDLEIVVLNLTTKQERVVSSRSGRNIHSQFSGDRKCLAFSGPGSNGKQSIFIVDLDSNKTQEISLAGDSFSPAPSSDCSFVVFEHTSSHGREILKYDAKTENMVSLTNDFAEARSPAISFDNQDIAFSGKKGEQWDIYLKSLRTGDELQVTNDAAVDLTPTFDANGGLVFVSERAGHFDFYRFLMPWLFHDVFDMELFLFGDADHYSPRFSAEIND